jgi:hypothetical protein
MEGEHTQVTLMPLTIAKNSVTASDAKTSLEYLKRLVDSTLPQALTSSILSTYSFTF